LLEGLLLRAPVQKVRIGDTEPLAALRRHRFVQQHQPFGLSIRQRTQQHAVNDAEDRCISADAKRECEDGNQREDWIFQQHSPAKAQVLKQTFRARSSPTFLG
jgi:hypothetical protein